MRIAYCSSIALPTDRVAGHHIARAAEALTLLGHEVHLFSPVSSMGAAGLESFYAFHAPVHHHLLESEGVVGVLRVLGGSFSAAAYRAALQRAIKKARPGKFDLAYASSPELIASLKLLRAPVVAEVHTLPRSGSKRFAASLKKAKLVVALTSQLRTALVELPLSEVPVIIEGNAVDDAFLTAFVDRGAARTRLGLPTGVQVVGYAGQLETAQLSRGMPEFLQALDTLRRRGLEFTALIAGGPQEAADRLRAGVLPELLPSVRFLGPVPHADVPAVLAACDVLVYPAPSSDDPSYLRDASPLEVFEYMASGVPIVCADLPPLRDILSESMAAFYAPAQPEGLADAIRQVLAAKQASMARALVAKVEVEKYTWKRRMGRILEAVGVKG